MRSELFVESLEFRTDLHVRRKRDVLPCPVQHGEQNRRETPQADLEARNYSHSVVIFFPPFLFFTFYVDFKEECKKER